MPPRRVVLAFVLAVMLAGCDGPERSFGYLTAPSATVPVPASPGPSPPSPSPGPTEGQPIPGSGPTYRPGVGTITVASGQTVDSRTEPTDPACWPNWDASGRCKAFEITAPFDGTVTVTVQLASQARTDEIDLFLIDPGRTYVISYSGLIAEEASLPVVAGSSYGIVVMTYSTPVPFQLRVEVVPR